MNSFLVKVDRVFDMTYPDFNKTYIFKDNKINLYFVINTLYRENHITFKKLLKNTDSFEMWEFFFKIALLLFNRNYNVSQMEEIKVNFLKNNDGNDYSFTFAYVNSNKIFAEITKNQIVKYIKKFNK